MLSDLEDATGISPRWIGFTQEELDNSGRIHKTAYIASITALFVLCWLSAFVRFYRRFYQKRIFSADDVFLLLGLGCITTTVGILYTILNEIFTASGYQGPSGLALAIQPGFLDIVFQYVKDNTIVCMLSWGAICCVKLSFLFLFRKLIDRMMYIWVYWWFVLVYVLAVSGYGFATYVLVCPYFFDLRIINCGTTAGTQRILKYAITQITLDAFGDLLILVIPLHIIYKVNYTLKQKFGLALSLCLSVVVICVTITRGAGIFNSYGKLDSLWEGYWNIVSAEVGLIMVSATAFRGLYIDRSKGATSHRLSKALTGQKAKFALLWYKTRRKHMADDVESRTVQKSSQQLSDSDYGRNSTEPVVMALGSYTHKAPGRRSETQDSGIDTITESEEGGIENLSISRVSSDGEILDKDTIITRPVSDHTQQLSSWHGTERATLEHYPRV